MRFGFRQIDLKNLEFARTLTNSDTSEPFKTARYAEILISLELKVDELISGLEKNYDQAQDSAKTEDAKEF